MLPVPTPLLTMPPGLRQLTKERVSVMEGVAYLMDEPISLTPACACPVVAHYANAIHDRLPPSRRPALLSRVPRIAVSRATEEVELRRVECAADFALQAVLPALLERSPGYESLAAPLKALPPYSVTTQQQYADTLGAIRGLCEGIAARQGPNPLDNATAQALCAVRALEYVLPIQGRHLFKLATFVEVAGLLQAGELFLLDVMLEIGNPEPRALTDAQERRLADLAYLTSEA